MKIAGIIAEYNPFHCGHRYQIDELRAQGASHVVAVMSPNIVQRGGLAVFSKWARAEAALRNGVDLVIELPAVWANTSAERFAFAAAFLLHSMGCVDQLCFGSECGDLALLQQAAAACMDSRVDRGIKEYLQRGLPYHAARERAINKEYGREISEVLSRPNDILAVEYLKALAKLSSKMAPMLIQRCGAAHDSQEINGSFASASRLREMLEKGEISAIRCFVPPTAWEIYYREWQQMRAPALIQRVEPAFLYQLRSMNPEDFAQLPDVSEGLEYRLSEAARIAGSMNDFLSTAKTKRYTHSRLRRIVMASLLGVTSQDLKRLPGYLRILGLNSRGAQIAHEIKCHGSLPLESSFSRLETFGHMAQIESAATDLFGQALPKVQPGKADYWQKIVKI